MEDSSFGNNDMFDKGRRMKMLPNAAESLSWLTGGKFSKGMCCLSLIDFVFTASVKVFPVTQNTDRVLEVSNQEKKNSFAS